MIRLRLHLPGVPAGQHHEVHICEDCPCYRDPDPRPAYCTLDVAWEYAGPTALRGMGGTRQVDVGGPIPSNCPLLRMQVEVLERAPSDTQEVEEP